MKQTSRGKADNKIKDTCKVGQKEEVHFLRQSGKMSHQVIDSLPSVGLRIAWDAGYVCTFLSQTLNLLNSLSPFL